MHRPFVAFRTALALAVACFAAAGAAAEEHVSLVPAHAPPWRASHALAALRDGARAPRELRVEAEPAGARLELSYLRAGVQLARAEGSAPLVATLPSLVRTGEDDRVVVRAESAGFLPREAAFAVASAPLRLRLALQPRPPVLLAAALLELGQRSRLELLSDRPLDARLATTQAGWRLVLAEVASGAAFAERLGALRGRAVARAEASAVGADLLVELTRGAGERRAPRLVRSAEPVRGVSHLALEWLPEDRGASDRARAVAALAALRDPFGACSAAFEEAIVKALGAETLGRALAPNGAFTDAYVSLALERLAAASPRGDVALRDGSRVALADEVARARVLAQAADARGLIVAIRAVAEALAPPGDAPSALHAWLAPEREPQAFAADYARGSAAEASCRAHP